MRSCAVLVVLSLLSPPVSAQIERELTAAKGEVVSVHEKPEA